jgi:hypothetical protein
VNKNMARHNRNMQRLSHMAKLTANYSTSQWV